MAKDPAFLFYSDNFQSGTQFLSDEQLGKYIRLLCAQHLHGHLTEKQMLHICKTYDFDVWQKFKKDDDGNYYNERLEIEVGNRKRYSESRSNNRKSKSKKKKHMKNISKTYEQHMEDEIEIEDENKNVFTWSSIKKNFFNDFRWKEKFCRDKKIGMAALEEKMNEFISDTELREDFKLLSDLKSHFTNTFNKNKSNVKPGTSEARIAAAKNW